MCIMILATERGIVPDCKGSVRGFESEVKTVEPVSSSIEVHYRRMRDVDVDGS